MAQVQANAVRGPGTTLAPFPGLRPREPRIPFPPFSGDPP